MPTCLNMVGQSKTRKYSENIYSILTFAREKSGIEQSSDVRKRVQSTTRIALHNNVKHHVPMKILFYQDHRGKYALIESFHIEHFACLTLLA